MGDRPAPRSVIRVPRQLRVRTTPVRLRLLLAVLIVGTLGWGALAAAVVATQAGAASEVVTSAEPLSRDAQQMYQKLADADITVSTGFLQGDADQSAMVSDQQRYDSDLATATADLRAITTESNGDPAISASLLTLNQDLPVYSRYVADSQTYDSVGLLAGASYTEVSSEEMRETLLPAAASVYTGENARLNSASAQGSGLPLIAVVLVAAIAVGYLLIRAQRWLARRTNRRLNLGLLFATGVGVIAVIWLVVAFGIARSNLDHASAQGAGPVETLAQADITAVQARGDETLNLVSRAGDGSAFQKDFTAKKADLASLLASAQSASGPVGATASGAARTAANSFFSLNSRVAVADQNSDYATETSLVIGSGSSAFAGLDSDITKAINDGQLVFSQSASAGSSAYDGLAVGLIIAALLMAAGCLQGLSGRLAEYR
jgi:hypothetical protein